MRGRPLNSNFAASAKTLKVCEVNISRNKTCTLPPWHPVKNSSRLQRCQRPKASGAVANTEVSTAG
eukprot:9211016-Pyramimonas_sp.AAC.1